MSISLSMPNAPQLAHPLAHSIARAAMPHMDRRAYTDRRTPLKPMPVVERAWARHALVAGCLGALLGSTAAFALLQKQQIDAADQSALSAPLETALPAAAVMAPLFDTAAFSSSAASTVAPSAVTGVPSASASLLKAESTANPGSESYSEDAAGVPSATYHEPPKAAPASPAR
jgi:hypothetical protein